MIFFTFLIGACVAIQSGVLKPVSHEKSVVSLIQTAKTDPRALIQMLEGADKETLKTVLNLLIQLRDEAIGEQSRLTLALAKTTKSLAVAKGELQRLQGIEIAKHAEMTAALKAYNTALGVLKERKQEHDGGKPRLDKEIEVFTKVLVILRNLLNGQPQSKGLLELGASAQGQSYQKMIENIKADPEKLKKVITIVNKLLTQSKAELKLLKDQMDKAQVDKDAKFTAYKKALAVHGAARAAVTAQKTVVQQATGAFEEAKREHTAEYPVVSKERATLEEVISIINGMLKAQG